MRLSWANTAIMAVLVLGVNVSSNVAQEAPWFVFPDPETDAACDVVNAGNLEVVVLSDTGELVVVTDDDYTLDEAAFVSDGGVYFFGGIPVGTVDFADDGNGFRTAWLLAPDGTVLELDPDTGEPVFTNLFPDDFVGVPCDAFELWDDDDFDDVPDEFDFCPETPLGEIADADGCSCSEFDEDDDGIDDCDDECPFTPTDELADDFGCSCSDFDEDDDGINDCFDECPGTPFGVDVDQDGCEIVIVIDLPPVVVQPPPVTIVCGNFSTLAMALTFGTLVTLRLARRRFS